MGEVISKDSPRARRARPVDARKREALEAAEAVVQVGRRAREIHDEAVEIATQMVRTFLGQAVEIDPGLLAQHYRMAVAAMRHLGPGVVRIHPEAPGKELLASHARTVGFSVREDPQVDRLGCIVEAGQATWDTTLSALSASLTKVVTGAWSRPDPPVRIGVPGDGEK